jgi:hypothetical protein
VFAVSNFSVSVPSKTVHFSTVFCRMRATGQRVRPLSVTCYSHVSYNAASWTINVAVVDSSSRRFWCVHVTATHPGDWRARMGQATS